ncbi:N-acetylglucosamine kinase [uncultured Pseudokineococcus sp.]|uniref:N-acetylglucosamine kinase n=1 Tax=uncultured Pseudokineococcus sp. TaxID=1642928 RepID=UPI0026281BD2|nr:BadF/BadG/BcrA/BcrD ATPase family protein [uncultured Pseudokineococcus sp.]
MLAADAGGTSTRVVVLEPDGICRGWATGPAGNPTSAGAEAALASLGGTAALALRRAGRAADEVGDVLVAMAGNRRLLDPGALAAALGYAGEPGRLRTGPDILAMYFSGSAEPTGCAVVAGTGSVGAVVREGRVARAVGGCGWLLGDGGSGFALGHAVARAVVAELEGTGPPTALTPLVVDAAGLDGAGRDGGGRGGSGRGGTSSDGGPAGAATDEELEGRPRALQELMDVVYAGRPVALARFAPLAFAAGPDDEVARGVVDGAQDDLARLVAAVRAGAEDAPLVLGGSALHHGLLAPGRPRTAALRAALDGADVRPARDGVVGAAVAALAQRAGPGGRVPAEVVERLHETVAAQRTAAGAGEPGAGGRP